MHEWKRPWSTPDEMDEALIDNWNAKVDPRDTVWHLGDVAPYAKPERLLELRKRLNGHIHLVMGNHDDNFPLPILSAVFDMVFPGHVATKFDGKMVVLCHYRMMVWKNSHHKSWHLYGHSHGKLMPADSHTTLVIDVGVDARHRYFPEEPRPSSYVPWSWDEVKKFLELKALASGVSS